MSNFILLPTERSDKSRVLLLPGLLLEGLLLEGLLLGGLLLGGLWQHLLPAAAAPMSGHHRDMELLKAAVRHTKNRKGKKNTNKTEATYQMPK